VAAGARFVRSRPNAPHGRVGRHRPDGAYITRRGPDTADPRTVASDASPAADGKRRRRLAGASAAMRRSLSSPCHRPGRCRPTRPSRSRRNRAPAVRTLTRTRRSTGGVCDIHVVSAPTQLTRRPRITRRVIAALRTSAAWLVGSRPAAPHGRVGRHRPDGAYRDLHRPDTADPRTVASDASPATDGKRRRSAEVRRRSRTCGIQPTPRGAGVSRVVEQFADQLCLDGALARARRPTSAARCVSRRGTGRTRLIREQLRATRRPRQTGNGGAAPKSAAGHGPAACDRHLAEPAFPASSSSSRFSCVWPARQRR
jgi:hypothetical protein